MSFLHYLKQRDFSQCCAMIDAGFDINIEGRNILNSPMLYNMDMDIDIVEFLLDEIPNLDLIEPLRDVIRENKIEYVKLLLNYVDYDQQDQIGYTALHVAVFHNHIDIVQILLARNSNGHIFTDVNSYNKSQNSTPLFSAVNNRNLETIKCLLEQGANPNSITKFGTPLEFAITILHKRYDIIQLLLDYGASFDNIQTDDPKVLKLFEYYRVDIKEPDC